MSDVDLKDDIELVPTEDIIPYSNNPKEHPQGQVKKIVSSIKNYGWDVPIVVDGGNEIIKGHGRLKAAEVLGLERVPIIRREDLSDAEKKAARIADNKTAESDWSEDLLEAELEVLEDEAVDLETLGFDEGEIEDLLAEAEDDEAVVDPEVDFATELFEENNYVVFQFDNKMDWQVIQDELGLETVKALDSEGDYVQKGVGRVLDGQELLDRL
jgi:ParB-like chromosome segregation protein Spo0J